MAKTTHYPARPIIPVGIPFSWGAQNMWYMVTDGGTYVCLTTGALTTRCPFRNDDPTEQLVFADSVTFDGAGVL